MDIKYFDNAATTALDKDTLDRMMSYFSDCFYNPSSIYSASVNAFNAIEEARSKVANALNAKANEIYFTSGGSESDNLALKGFAYANSKKGKHIITSCIEHPAIINSCKTLEKDGFEVTYVSVLYNGIVNLEARPFEFKDEKSGEMINGISYFVVTVDENGEVYECKVKASRQSDKQLLAMILR